MQVLNGAKIALSGEDYTYAFDLSKLAEGRYDLNFFLAKDTFENETSSPFITLVHDMTPLRSALTTTMPRSPPATRSMVWRIYPLN
jgi:hypothetical protein